MHSFLTTVATVLLIVVSILGILAGLVILAILTLLLVRLLVRAVIATGAQKKYGLLRYHETTTYKHLQALRSRFKGVFGAGAAKDKPAAVVNFDGDIRASARKPFATLVDELIVNSSNISEAVVVINSPGGMVSEYGLLFAEMQRLRESNVPLTVCIDTCAASGGYLMSLPANRIVAAPFATVGSVGVVANVPSLHRWLKKHEIEPRQFTAGQYKRTVTLTEEDSEEAKQHFQGQLEAIHRLFLEAVAKYRPNANLEAIKTGDHWTASESIENDLGLVDEIATSRQYLLKINKDRDLIQIVHKSHQLRERLGGFMGGLYSRLGSP